MTGPRAVEVAVDAAGRGGDRTYTYLVPGSLADLGPGEAVLVEFGRRQALGIVIAEVDVASSVALKPIIDRVRADGPLLPRLTLALARVIAAHYLAPPALVLRAMLPPGLLERLELVAEVVPQPIGGTVPAGAEAAVAQPTDPETDDPVIVDLLGQLERGPRPVRDLAGPDGRAGLLRRLKALERAGWISLEWTLLGAGAGPRYERWIRLADSGRAMVAALATGGRSRAAHWEYDNRTCSGSLPTPFPGSCRRPTLPVGMGAVPWRVSCVEDWLRPRYASDRGGPWRRDLPAGVAVVRRPAICSRHSPRRSPGSKPRSSRVTPGRSCSMG